MGQHLGLEGHLDFEHVVMDSTSIEAVLYARVGESQLARFPDCNIGWKTTQKRYYFGQKLHLATSLSGVMLNFRLTKASLSDHKGFAKLNNPKIRSLSLDSGYKGDKGFAGQELIFTKPWGTSLVQRFLNGQRVVVEQVFGFLKHLGLEGWYRLKTSRSLGSHVCAVLACFRAIQLLNLRAGLNPCQFKRFLL